MSGGKYVDSEGCSERGRPPLPKLPPSLPTPSTRWSSARVWKPRLPTRSCPSATRPQPGSALRVGRGSCAGTSLHRSHPGTGQHLQAQQQGHGRRAEREASVRRAHQGDRPGQPRP
uniref:Caveolin 1 n=1 Tax=Homo sapiens TaxID=9606 RepID=A0A7P0YWJ6_HUMAN